MQSQSKKNNGFKYILITIDTFTKYVWASGPCRKKTMGGGGV